MNTEQRQQGDVTFVRRDASKGEDLERYLARRERRVMKRSDSRGTLLALGEVTGHAHATFQAGGIKVFTNGFQSNTPSEIYVPEGQVARITHEEHGTVELGEGVWEVGFLNAYDYLNDRTTQVLD